MKREPEDEPEIREMAEKLLRDLKDKNDQKIASEKMHKTRSINMKRLHPDLIYNKFGIDEESVKGRFGWSKIGEYHAPYIFRTNESRVIEKYCALRIVEMAIWNKYLTRMRLELNTCVNIESFYATQAECALLNEINTKHSEKLFGADLFTPRDLIIRFNDAVEFHKFLEIVFSKINRGIYNQSEQCGFIRINKESALPYTVKNGEKYVPIFFFDGDIEQFKKNAVIFEGWDLTYLKFGCRVQGIRKDLCSGDSCSVIALSTLKSLFPTGTVFQEYWPLNIAFLADRNAPITTNISQWIKQPVIPPLIRKIVPKPGTAVHPMFQNVPFTQAGKIVRMSMGQNSAGQIYIIQGTGHVTNGV